MKISTFVILCIGCVIAWPIAKDAALDKMVHSFMSQSQLSTQIGKSDFGPIGSMVANGFLKGIANNIISEKDIGTQILIVFRVLALDDVPKVPIIN